MGYGAEAARLLDQELPDKEGCLRPGKGGAPRWRFAECNNMLDGFARTKSTVAFERNFQPGRRFCGSLVLCAWGRSDGACPWNRR